MIGQYFRGTEGSGRFTENEILEVVAVKRLWNVDLHRQLRYYMAKNPSIMESDVVNKTAVGFGRKLVKTAAEGLRRGNVQVQRRGAGERRARQGPEPLRGGI